MSNTGKATVEGTKSFLENFNIKNNTLGGTNFSVSAAGFGCYRVDAEIEQHRQALHLAIDNGINIFDTSSNYTNGFSEECVGDVLNQKIIDSEIKRENVVVITKGGYIQGEDYIEVQAQKKEGKAFPEIVEYSKGLDHCIHPKFLETQLARSLDRLLLETIDIYLLHNPEYYLNYCKLNNVALADARNEYYRRIKEAFIYLESEVDKGRIQYYGVSSNTFIEPNESYDYTSYSMLIEIAKSISPNHHFKLIQCPFNLLENEASKIKNQSNNQTLFEACKTNNTAVLINRPFNAITPNQQFIRLTEFWPEDELSSLEIQDIVNQLMAFENSWENLNLEKQVDKETLQEIQAFFTIGSELHKNWPTFEGYEYWKEALSQYIVPRIEYGMSLITSNNELLESQQAWIEEYLSILNNLIAEVSNYYKSLSASRSQRLKAQLLFSLNQSNNHSSLSQLTLQCYYNIPAISSVLVGMRQVDYVNDVIISLKEESTLPTDSLNWEKVKERLISAI